MRYPAATRPAPRRRPWSPGARRHRATPAWRGWATLALLLAGQTLGLSGHPAHRPAGPIQQQAGSPTSRAAPALPTPDPLPKLKN